MSEILIITLFVILMVVLLAVVLITVELMTRGRVLRRNRVCNSRPFMVKTHVKECPPAKIALQPMEVKAVLLNLKKNKDKDKADTTKKDQ